eukprot:c11458_g1_i1.p1 GENE.c11458_g1_i1~~c11458_g1_i1.p1  ORF type:complete len:145 (+),score=24.51 c11458_g1_i1:473-907(+)
MAKASVVAREAGAGAAGAAAAAAATAEQRANTGLHPKQYNCPFIWKGCKSMLPLELQQHHQTTCPYGKCPVCRENFKTEADLDLHCTHCRFVACKSQQGMFVDPKFHAEICPNNCCHTNTFSSVSDDNIVSQDNAEISNEECLR